MTLTARDREFLGELAKVIMKWTGHHATEVPRRVETAHGEIDGALARYTEYEERQRVEMYTENDE